jgi:hypothetical protein
VAKKQSASSPDGKSAGNSSKRPPAKSAASKATTAAKSAEAPSPASASQPSKRVLEEEQIGKVAGEVWQVLSEHGGQSLPALKSAIDAPGDLVLASIGWLAREGKLDFAANSRSVTISLR